MKLHELDGVIERRLLVNYRVDPEVVATLLPSPFRAQLVGDAAVAGICPAPVGLDASRGTPSLDRSPQ